MCIKDIICCLKEALDQEEPRNIAPRDEAREMRNHIAEHTPYQESVIEMTPRRSPRNRIVEDKPGTPRRRIIRRVEV